MLCEYTLNINYHDAILCIINIIKKRMTVPRQKVNNLVKNNSCSFESQVNDSYLILKKFGKFYEFDFATNVNFHDFSDCKINYTQVRIRYVNSFTHRVLEPVTSVLSLSIV